MIPNELGACSFEGFSTRSMTRFPSALTIPCLVTSSTSTTPIVASACSCL